MSHETRGGDVPHTVPDPEPGESAESFDLKSVRARLHNQNDILQAHIGKLTEHDVRLTVAERQILVLSTSGATREQLEAAERSLGEKVASSVALLTLQIKGIADDVAPVKSVLNRLAYLVISAVILAALAFLFKKP